MQIKIFDNSLEKFIGSLQKPTIAKALRTIDLLEAFGSRLGMPHSKKVANRLFELRIRSEQEVRVLYTFHKASIILLRGFIKKSNKIPRKELRLALEKLKGLDDI